MSKRLRSVILGSLIFVGLPLLGWGLGDLSGYFENTARLLYAVAAIGVQVVVITVLWGASKISKTERSTPDLIALQVLSLALVVLAPYTDRHAILPLVEVGRYVGVVLFTLGFLGMMWAQAHLGRMFSYDVNLQDQHQLITDGPYRLIRHPRYLGIMAFSLGVALTFSSGVAVLVALGMAGVLLWRVQVEEAMLQQAFGAAWEAYRAQTWRLIPYVY